MSNSVCSLDFSLGQKVKIVELEREGRIVSIWITKAGIQYEVRYFDAAEAKTVYFFSDELIDAAATTKNK